MSEIEKKIVLGPEHDERLRDILRGTLRFIGARQIGKAENLLGGSQELDSLEVEVAGQRVLIESETYIGLSLSGPLDPPRPCR